MTYTLTTETLVLILSALAVVLPGAYWLGRFAHRLDAVEKMTSEMAKRIEDNTNRLTSSIEILRRELLMEIRRSHVNHDQDGGV